MDSFGNPLVGSFSGNEGSQPSGGGAPNPYSGGNSIQNYFSFLKKSLASGATDASGSQTPQQQKLLGPMKWDGPKTQQVSGIGTPHQATPKLNINTWTPQIYPQQQQQQQQQQPAYDPYAAAARMNANMRYGSGTWTNYVDQGGYGMGSGGWYPGSGFNQPSAGPLGGAMGGGQS